MLLALLFVAPAAGQVSTTIQNQNVTFEIDWDVLASPNYRSAEVGNIVEFTWNGTQSIYLQHTNHTTTSSHFGAMCNVLNAIDITENVTGPPVYYTFTADEAYTEVVFTGSLESGCFANDTLTFSVEPTPANRLKDCSPLGSALQTCMDNAGASGPRQLSCETCIQTSVVTAQVGSRSPSCVTNSSAERACKAFVGCSCKGCSFEAAAYGSCEIDMKRGSSCPITDCSPQVAAVSSAFAAKYRTALSSILLSVPSILAVLLMMY